ncbi:MAG: KpsF/GutQ family sugar-phosphate isomerase [Pseudomonadota bacterium]
MNVEKLIAGSEGDRSALIQRTASRVISTEANALTTMSKALPEDFVRVVDVILNCDGRVIIGGIGKSGHIGNKIAATLASTGTPAHFVHAAEASHGDLGMVTPKDICVLISRSGETTELRDLIAYTRRFSIPLIGISANSKSTLMRAADLQLLLPDAPETCAIGMAPTTSTTLTLALGDALAVALMEQRQFQPDRFRDFHPGGRLGAQLARTGQIMHEGDQIPLVTPTTSMADTLIEMTSKGFGIAGIVEDNRLSGVISDGDLRRNMDLLLEKVAGDVATSSPHVLSPTVLVAEALAFLNENKISAVFIVDDENHPLGIIHVHDCLRVGAA